jgi:hypothetical protein
LTRSLSSAGVTVSASAAALVGADVGAVVVDGELVVEGSVDDGRCDEALPEPVGTSGGEASPLAADEGVETKPERSRPVKARMTAAIMTATAVVITSSGHGPFARRARPGFLRAPSAAHPLPAGALAPSRS